MNASHIVKDNLRANDLAMKYKKDNANCRKIRKADSGLRRSLVAEATGITIR